MKVSSTPMLCTPHSVQHFKSQGRGVDVALELMVVYFPMSVSSEIAGCFLLFTAVSVGTEECLVHSRYLINICRVNPSIHKISLTRDSANCAKLCIKSRTRMYCLSTTMLSTVQMKCWCHLPLQEEGQGLPFAVLDVDLELGVEGWTNRNRKDCSGCGRGLRVERRMYKGMLRMDEQTEALRPARDVLLQE